jgi:hypothetical protein
MNGTGLQLNNITKGAKVVHVLTSSERGEIASILAYNNAEVTFIPRAVIMKA